MLMVCVWCAWLSLLQDRDTIVKGLKAQIKNAITQSGGNPQAKIMEPLLNQPTSSFEFAFKIRVRAAAVTHTGHLLLCSRGRCEGPEGADVQKRRSKLLPSVLLVVRCMLRSLLCGCPGTCTCI
jgi:hypothetical protein